MTFISSLTSTSAALLSPRSSGSSDRQTIALAVSLGVIGCLIVGGIIYYTLRFRRQTITEDTWYPLSSGATLVDSRHIASRITPFGTRDAHEPGKDMRIAKRRSNGVWEFSNPDGQFSPSGIGDMDVKPAPRKQSKDKLAMAGPKLPARGYLDVEALAYPPPAYGV